MTNFIRLFQVSLLLLIVACGGSGGSGISGDSGNSDTIIGDPDGKIDENAESGLIQRSYKMPTGPAASAGDPLVSETGRTQAASVDASPAVVFEVTANHSQSTGENCQALGALWGACSVINIHIKDATGSLNDSDWSLYFHSIRRVLRIDSDEFELYHVNGDLHYLAPTDAFTGFSGNPVKSIKLFTEFSWLHQSDFMPRAWISRPGRSPVLIANTDTSDYAGNYSVPISGDNRYAFIGEGHEIANPANRYERYSFSAAANGAARIVPAVASAELTGGTLTLGGSLDVGGEVLGSSSIAAVNQRLATFHQGSGRTPISTALDSSMDDGAYSLNITGSAIDIAAGSPEAVFNALQSILSLVTPGQTDIPQISIQDQPRFNWRGMHVDVSRNFRSVAALKTLIDQMAAYKLNRLHLHLSDDEGWRLEIPGLPELTSVGGRRAFNTDSDNQTTEASGLLSQLGSGPTASAGFYTRSQFVDLLKYAKDRYITIVPAFDMPGHARAAVVAMRARAARISEAGDTRVRVDDPLDTTRLMTVQHYRDGLLNPCVDGTWNFATTLIEQVGSMYEDAGVPLTVWHMGGDEAGNVLLGGGSQGIDHSQWDQPWSGSPRCQALMAADSSLNSVDDLEIYFIRRFAEIAAANGIETLYAYQDILKPLDPSTIATQKIGASVWDTVWGGAYDSALDWPARGYQTLLTVPDFLYFDHPQAVDPAEPGYYWATRFIDTQKVFSFAPENLPQNADTSVNKNGTNYTASSSKATQRFEGIQGQLWSETIRTRNQFDYMVYPRLLALAERAWHRAPWEQPYAPGQSYSGNFSSVDRQAFDNDWASFAEAVGQRELAKLDAAGIGFRIAAPGARSVAGLLQMNAEFPGLQLEYSTDGTSWSQWNTANPPTGATWIRSRFGRRTSRPTRID